MKSLVIKEVKPKIFLLQFKNHYDMSMHFLRYQEFYESSSSKFYGKSFKLLDFMKWYSEKYGNGLFTYPIDWAGFNIPGEIISEVWDLGIPDCNKYDYCMLEVLHACQKKSPGKVYLIGACPDNEEEKAAIVKHEIAHGFFYTRPEYKKEMMTLVKNLEPDFRQSMEISLKKMGYASRVYIDECQAYLSTGITPSFDITLNGEDQVFIETFNKYYNE
jgi:hypothetical protein